MLIDTQQPVDSSSCLLALHVCLPQPDFVSVGDDLGHWVLACYVGPIIDPSYLSEFDG